MTTSERWRGAIGFIAILVGVVLQGENLTPRKNHSVDSDGDRTYFAAFKLDLNCARLLNFFMLFRFRLVILFKCEAFALMTPLALMPFVLTTFVPAASPSGFETFFADFSALMSDFFWIAI